MQKKSFDRDAARRRVILDAARECILKFGYAKSPLEDIAQPGSTNGRAIGSSVRKWLDREPLIVRSSAEPIPDT